MHKNIDEIEFTIFDTETTGLEPESGDRVVEIAGIRFKGRERISTFQTFINPHRPISEAAFGVNKISSNMLIGAPETIEAIPKFLDFARDSCLCAYNAVFDLDFLNNELKLIGAASPNNAVVDILKMAKRIMPGLERYSLRFVAAALGIKTEQAHRAFSDVELTLDVFNKLNAKLQERGVSDFANFLSLFGLNSRFSDGINTQKLAKIQEAMDLGVRLKIKYLSGLDASVSEREVIPKEIKQERNTYYLLGFCCLRNQERTFRVDGILHLEIL
jgi:DNA polymerase III epsilon subunit family exonuclease